MSARGFGFGASAAAGYAYLIMPDIAGTISATTTLNSGGTTTLLKSGAYNQLSYYQPFLVLDGQVIASDNYYSTNGGASYIIYNGVNPISNTYAGGINCGGAYRSSSKTVVSLISNLTGKYTYGGFGYATPTTNGSVLWNISAGSFVMSVVYSPALDVFVTQDVYGNLRSYYGSSVTSLAGTNSFGSTGNYQKMFISSDGYPIVYSFNGSNYNMNKIISADMLSYQNLGAQNDSYKGLTGQGAAVWSSTYGLYFKPATSTSAVYAVYSADAVNWTGIYLGAPYGGNSYPKTNIVVAPGEVNVMGIAYLPFGKSAGGYPYQLRSTDGGSSWTTINKGITGTKNLQ